jgi:hypothetical protein
MTISSSVNRSGPYNGNGVTTVFDYDFKIVNEDHLTVIKRSAAGVESVLTIDADYIVSDVGNANGGQIACTSAPASGETITILLNVPFTQETDLQNQGAYYAETVEAGFDLAAQRDLQLAERLDRAVTIPASADPAVLDGLIEDVLRLADSADNIDTVAGISGDVSTVAGIAANVSTVAGVAVSVQTVAGIAGDVSTVAGIAEDISAAVDNMAAIVDAPNQAAAAAVSAAAAATSEANAAASAASVDGGAAGLAVLRAEDTAALTTALAGAVDDSTLSNTSALYSRITYVKHIFDYFTDKSKIAAVVAGTSTDDHLIYLQAAADSGLTVIFPPYTFNVSAEVVIKDGTKFIGAGAFFKRRALYADNEGSHTTIKYIGAGGTNSCVVRVSAQAVGTKETDFTAPATDDLVAVTLRDIHVDCNNLAEYGWYMYRCGNTSDVNNITAERAKERGVVLMGIYAANWGRIGAYACEKHGVSVGEDIWSFGSESTVYEFVGTFDLCGNGTAGTYIKDDADHDLDGSGGVFTIGRGSDITIMSESNVGRAALIVPYTADTTTMYGPVIYRPRYIEGNGDGLFVEYRTGAGSMGHVIRDGYIHPGNGSTLASQDITIVAKSPGGVVQTNAGPTDPRHWLRLENLKGESSGASFAVKSNTTRYRMVDCAGGVTFSNKRPAPKRILGMSGAAISHTGDTSAFTFATVDVPSYCMGKNGALRITCLWSTTSSANNKTLAIKFGTSAGSGTTYMGPNVTTAVTTRTVTTIQNRNSELSQVGGVNNSVTFDGSSSSAAVTSSIDTRSASVISIMGTCANPADTITLEGYMVELISDIE